MRRTDLLLEGEDGEHLAVVDDSPDGSARALVVVVHGLTGDRVGPNRLFVSLAAELLQCATRVVRFDLRGAGDSSGDVCDTTFSGMVADTNRVIEHARRTDPSLPLVLVGMSLGALVASLVAAQRRDVAGVVLVAHVLSDDAPPPPLDGRVGAGHIAMPPSFFAERALLQPRSAIMAADTSILEIVGSHDSRPGRDPSPWRSVTVPGADHLFASCESRSTLIALTREFVETLTQLDSSA